MLVKQFTETIIGPMAVIFCNALGRYGESDAGGAMMSPISEGSA